MFEGIQKDKQQLRRNVYVHWEWLFGKLLISLCYSVYDGSFVSQRIYHTDHSKCVLFFVYIGCEFEGMLSYILQHMGHKISLRNLPIINTNVCGFTCNLLLVINHDKWKLMNFNSLIVAILACAMHVVCHLFILFVDTDIWSCPKYRECTCAKLHTDATYFW